MGNIKEQVGAEGEGEGDGDGDADRRDADSAFDDLIIEVDESELEAELNDQPPDRKS